MTGDRAVPLTVNVPLLRKAVEWVEEQSALPERLRQWHQDVFYRAACGTAMCVAGYIADLAGTDWSVSESAMAVDGRYAAEIAEEVLGLPLTHGMWASNNTAADSRRIAEGFAGERL